VPAYTLQNSDGFEPCQKYVCGVAINIYKSLRYRKVNFSFVSYNSMAQFNSLDSATNAGVAR